MDSAKAKGSTINNFVTSVMIYPISILVGILTARALGPEGRGIYVYLVLLIKGILPILMFGYGSGVQYYTASKAHPAETESTTNVAVSLLWGTVVALIIYALWQHGYLGETGRTISFEVLWPVLVAIPLNAVYFTAALILKGDFRFKLINRINMVKAVGLAVLLVVFVIWFGLGLLGASLALLLEAVVTFVYILYTLWRCYAPAFVIHTEVVRDNIIYGSKSWLGTLAQQSNDRLDQILIGFFASPGLLVLYSVAFSIVQLMNFLPNAIAPVFFNLTAASKDLAAEVRLTGRIHRVLLLLVGLSVVGMALAAPLLIRVMYGAEFAGAIIPLYILIPGMLAFSVTRRILSKYIAGKGDPVRVSIIQGVGAIVGAALYFLLIPSFDIIGAAVASTLAYISSSALAVYYFRKMIRPYSANLFAISRDDLRWARQHLQGPLAKITGRFR